MDDPLHKYVPEFSIHGPPGATVTLRGLASHTAGMPREIPCIESDCDLPDATVFARLANESLIHFPYTRPAYRYAAVSNE